MATYIRQPIVSVLGHVDHGKSSLLDEIRGTSVVAREAGGITQHIGATEVPMDAILAICGDLVKGKVFKIPGLLFIDTPGHVAFTTLRARGGALADLAVLVVDVNEGFRPQTIESINILKRYKTPFLVAANKIDMVPGWREKGFGPTLDAIIYKGVLNRGDTIVLGATGRPIVTKVKAVLRPKPLDEIRDPQDRFDSVERVTAAAGVKIAGSGLEGATSGGPLREAKPKTLSAIIEAVAAETVPKVETSEEGILVKADALGSLEAIAYECKAAGMPIKFARVGPVSRRDIVDAATVAEPLHKVILAFNVPF